MPGLIKRKLVLLYQYQTLRQKALLEIKRNTSEWSVTKSTIIFQKFFNLSNYIPSNIYKVKIDRIKRTIEKSIIIVGEFNHVSQELTEKCRRESCKNTGNLPITFNKRRNWLIWNFVPHSYRAPVTLSTHRSFLFCFVLFCFLTSLLEYNCFTMVC